MTVVKYNPSDYDFSGWATVHGIKCTDGRTIKHGAFKKNDGQKVPLVWRHDHDSPSNILGHVVLEHLDKGVRAWGKFNQTESGDAAKALVMHGDIDSLSIYANQLTELELLVHDGNIREVSLVLAGANKDAKIDYVTLFHSDGENDHDEEALIYSGETLEIKHTEEPNMKVDPKGVEEIIEAMTPEQQEAVFALVNQALNTDVAQSDDDYNTYTGEKNMKENVFDTDTKHKGSVLSHDQMNEIIRDAVKGGSLKESFLQHAVTYGIENIDYLFPDAKTLTNKPILDARDMGWVTMWMNTAHKNPFSRIKTVIADIKEDSARALGYIKGNLKKDEFFALAKRVTTPTTIFKKVKLDRDDIIDITDFDVVSFQKGEMRIMLDEEIARACLIGDGRDVASPDKISETNIRPVYRDSELFTIRRALPASTTLLALTEEILKARKDYKGVGNPVMFTTTDVLTDMLLLKDTLNRRLYNTVDELKSALRVSMIVEVPVMEGVTRTDTVPSPDVVYDLKAILLNPKDYVMGADAGGQVSMFDDFDIDFNQYKYLMETRMSGSLIKPHTAIVIEQAQV